MTTIKNTLLALCFTLVTMPCKSQSLFFDNLNGSVWTSYSEITDSTLISDMAIPLAKLKYSRDSINKDVSIWTFSDSVLTITKYSFRQKTETLVGNYAYQASEKGILHIILLDGTTLNYTVGIVSTGYYALLQRKKDKKRKRRQ